MVSRMSALAKALQRLEVLGENAQRPTILALEEVPVLVGECAADAEVGPLDGMRYRDTCEIDEAALDVGAQELHLHAIADVETLESTDDPALDGGR